MKRRRPILYEVFGSPARLKGLEERGAKERGRLKRKRAPTARRKAPPRFASAARASRNAFRELRVSYELAAVVGLLVVVLGGTLYYFGTVRGKASGDTASLSTGALVEPGPGEEAAPSRGPARPPAPKSYYAVRVYSAGFRKSAKDPRVDQIESFALDAYGRLEELGYQDVQAVWMPSGQGQECVVLVGRAQDAKQLESLKERLKAEKFKGETAFRGAFITPITE